MTKNIEPFGKRDQKMMRIVSVIEQYHRNELESRKTRLFEFSGFQVKAWILVAVAALIPLILLPDAYANEILKYVIEVGKGWLPRGSI